MDISKHIYDYLTEYNTSVIVPDLGCFNIVNKPSEIKDGIVLPPVKTVVLDSNNTVDDNVLTLYIARRDGISVEQAKENVRKFYQHFFIRRLSAEKSVVFENFGVFALSEYGDITFRPVSDFFSNSYGLGYAYIPRGATQQPSFEAGTAIPAPLASTVIPEPVVTPNPPVVTDATQSIETKPVIDPESSLFNTSDSTRFRENTERRRPLPERHEPPARPIIHAKTAHQPKKQKQTKSSSNKWVLWALPVAVGLGVAAYYAYPFIAAGDSPLSAFFKPKQVEKPAVAGISETEQPPVAETEQTPNDVGQTIDDATSKKKALNPASQPEISQAQPTAAISRAEPVAAVQPPATGRGRYMLIVASFATQAAAETFGQKLQSAGTGYEIVDAGNQRYRISVGGFDNKTEAIRQAEQFKSRPYCENVWVAKRF